MSFNNNQLYQGGMGGGGFIPIYILHIEDIGLYYVNLCQFCLI